MIKIVLGSLLIGAVLGLVVFCLMAGFEEAFVTMSGGGGFNIRARGGPLILPVFLGVGAGWVASKSLERFSDISGTILVFILSLAGGAAAFGVAMGLASGQLQRMSNDMAMTIAGLASISFVATATWRAYLDE